MPHQIPLRISVLISKHNGMPTIVLRRETNDLNLITGILEATLHNETIVVLPQFRDKLQSLNTMVKNGLIYYDNKIDQYVFNF